MWACHYDHALKMESLKQYSDDEDEVTQSKEKPRDERASNKERYEKERDRRRRRSRSRTPPRRRSHGHHSSRSQHRHSPHRHRSRSPPHRHSSSSDQDRQRRSMKQGSKDNDNGDSSEVPVKAASSAPEQVPAQPVKLPAPQPTAMAQKKKLLWNKKPTNQSWNNWESVSFEGNEMAQSKFRRLMGIKSGTTEGVKPEGTAADSTVLKNLESQYETSRYMTHLAKGAGLGFGIVTQNNTVDPHDTDKLNE